ncbi:hypothetical protein LCGC14_3133760 [marine sediment metagenome]|uniref:BLUF domain-containing protein n=1 Tax=marine sediment metagenome TaxID=412755 RepID=A0A0F8VYY0_9ZZZZ
MYTLTYESVEAYDLTTDELKLLFETSNKKNIKENITGCLVYYHGRFIQLLEGDFENIIRLYDRIKVDERHTEVHLFSDDTISERAFPEWVMAYFPLDRNLIAENELQKFQSNLSVLSDLMAVDNLTARLFWRRVKFNVEQP